MSKEELIELKEEIVFVTSNQGKMASAKEQLKGIKLEFCNHDLIEPRSDDVKKIAESKVTQAFQLVKKPCMALDAGFFIDALNGFPRAFVNFALDTLGIEGILKQMKDIENRSCRFKECLAYYDGEHMLYFYGNHEGSLAKEIRGKDTKKRWSDLWYIFIPYGYNKTLAEMTDEERLSRKRSIYNTSAMQEFTDYYQKNKQLVKK